jgi:ELWxxDGT repeat protein
MCAAGETTYLIADTLVEPDRNYWQIWKSDGSAAGTSLVWPGAIAPEIKCLDDVAYFLTFNESNYMQQLFRTQGTLESTQLLWEDFYINIHLLTSAKGMIFFSTRDENAVDPDTGRIGRASIFRTDGTQEGTTLLYELFGNLFAAASFTEYKGEIFFSGNDIDHGQELWKTDGTPEGTELFLDIDPGISYGYPADSNPVGLTVYDDLLFFSAKVEGYGDELWKSDGTTEGTDLVGDFWPGQCWFPGGYVADCGSGMSPLGVINDRLILRGVDESSDEYGIFLWASDGTDEGTVRIESPLVEVLWLRPPNNWVEFNGELFFGGVDFSMTLLGLREYRNSPCRPYGYELWKTDGTETGTVVVEDIAPCIGYPPDNAAGGLSFAQNFVVADDLLFFTARDDDGYHLWMTDGTVGEVSKIDYDRNVSAYANGTIFFGNDDDVHGHSLWAFRTKVFVDGCNTGITDQLYQGKYITTWIEECADSAENHGEFVSCVAHLTNDHMKAGIISGSEKDAIQICAAQANNP